MSTIYVCVMHHQDNCDDRDCLKAFDEPFEKVRQLELQISELKEDIESMTREHNECATQHEKEVQDANRLIGLLRTQLKSAVYFIHLDKHTNMSFDMCAAPVCLSANEILGDLAERPKYGVNGDPYNIPPPADKRKCVCGLPAAEGAKLCPQCERSDR